ncbi:hypothetical protein PMAYCL1PPCAC_03012, partial [Pristionchus mayeri]
QEWKNYDQIHHEGSGYDVKLQIGEKQIDGCKGLLMARMPFIRTLLSSNWADHTSPVINLHNFSADAVERLVEWANTGRLEINLE